MTGFWENMAYLVMGIVAGAFFGIEFTKHRWWSSGALQHYKELQDRVYAFECRERRAKPQDGGETKSNG